MDFALTPKQVQLRDRCLALAADFATRSSDHDRDASHPVENYDRLRREGFLHLTVPKSRGGSGYDFLDHSIAFEALGRGCPSTALAFNMHASVVMPLLESAEVEPAAKDLVTDLVVRQGKMIGGNFSESSTTSLLGARPLGVRARRADGGYWINGRKMFASMIEAADYVLVQAYPDEATNPAATILLLIPRDAPGRTVLPTWDTLGMRATRSDSLVLEDCWVPETAALYRTDDVRAFRMAEANWFWGSYTAVYLGLAGAAYDELRDTVARRRPEGFAQSLAWHPDVRRHIAELSNDLHAARLTTWHSAWLRTRDGPTAEANNALFRAKSMVGEVTARITRVALTLGGAHGIFRGMRLEQLFRDGALAPIQPPPTDFCLWNIGLHELGLDPADALPPMKPL